MVQIEPNVLAALAESPSSSARSVIAIANTPSDDASRRPSGSSTRSSSCGDGRAADRAPGAGGLAASPTLPQRRIEDGPRDHQPAQEEEAEQECGGRAHRAIRALLRDGVRLEHVRGEHVEHLDAGAAEQRAGHERAPIGAAMRQPERTRSQRPAYGRVRKSVTSSPGAGAHARSAPAASETTLKPRRSASNRIVALSVGLGAAARTSPQSSRWVTISARRRLRVT